MKDIPSQAKTCYIIGKFMNSSACCKCIKMEETKVIESLTILAKQGNTTLTKIYVQEKYVWVPSKSLSDRTIILRN